MKKILLLFIFISQFSYSQDSFTFLVSQKIHYETVFVTKGFVKESCNENSFNNCPYNEKDKVTLLSYNELGYFFVRTNKCSGYTLPSNINIAEEKMKELASTINNKKNEASANLKVKYENKRKKIAKSDSLFEAELQKQLAKGLAWEKANSEKYKAPSDKEIADRKKKNAERERRNIEKFGKSTYDKLKKRYYWIGMTKEMARIALGNPYDINRSAGSLGVHEQWVYDSKDIYLYFENGILTSYQN